MRQSKNYTREGERMRDLKEPCKIAVVQAAPVLFDKDGCVEKAVRLIQEG